MASEVKALVTRRPYQNVGICLCGGGINGAIYQVGCLAAIESQLEHLRTGQADLYMGTSSGAALATALAGGISVERLYRALLDPADVFFRLQRRYLLRLDNQEIRRAFFSSLMAFRKALSSAVVKPFEINLWRELERFVDCLPAGLFTLDRYERFFADFMLRRGIPERFDQLPKRLLITARDLDSGERALFGVDALSDVPVSRAVAACCAMPPFFSPVRIGDRDYVDGGLCDPAPVDLAGEFGCSLVIIIHPVIPTLLDDQEAVVPTGHGRKSHIRDKGLWWAYRQWLHLRSHSGIRSIVERFRQSYPQTEIVLLEPPPEAAPVFLHSPADFAARRAIIEEGYTATFKQLESRKASINQALAAVLIE